MSPTAAVPDPWLEAMRHSGRVLAVSRRFVSRHRRQGFEVADLYQEGMLIAHDVVARVSFGHVENANPGSYVAQAVHNRFVDMARHRERDGTLRACTLDPDRTYARPDRIDLDALSRAEAALGALDPRAGYILHHSGIREAGQPSTGTEIGRVLGLCRHQVGRIKQRALVSLRLTLGAD